MADPDTPRRPWRRVLFGLSLALNFLIVGAIIGLLVFARGGGTERPAAELRAAGRLPMAAMLPPEARGALRDGLRAKGIRNGAIWRANADRLDAALRADPFDPSGVSAILAERRALRDGRAAEVDAVLVNVLGELSRSERIAFADRMQRRHHKGRNGSKAERP